MRHIAIVGSGPAGYYTAEAAQKMWSDDVRVDVFDALPVPFGLIRTGVAPDHQSIKGVSRRYEKVATSDNVRFVGNVTIGSDVTIAELQELYDAVVLATGAPNDRTLAIAGADLDNVFGSAEFVGITGIPNSPRSTPIFPARLPSWSERGMSRSTWRAFSPRPRRSSPDRTSWAMRSTPCVIARSNGS